MSAGTGHVVADDGAGAWRVMPLEGAFQFSYHDAAGTPSLRQLEARELKVGPGKMLLGGTDLGTGAYRGFRVDRIHFLEDVECGEVISRNVLDWLLKRAQARKQSPVASRQRAPGPGALRR